MKITTILGSARKKGNTATVLAKFEDIAVSNGHEIDRINITNYKLNGCIGCDKCQSILDQPGCVQKDNMLSIFKRMIASDVIIYSTPLYAWSFTAQIKPLIDRQYCLVKNYDTSEYKSFLKDKKVALLVTCGGEYLRNADLIPIIFKRESDYLGCVVVGTYVVELCTTGNRFGINSDEIIQRMAEDIIFT
jgi:multimeric flavodoxin WrbA